MLTAIIVAAGTSQRMGFDKLFADLGGRPVVAWSVAAFQACAAVDGIVLVTRPEKEVGFPGTGPQRGLDQAARDPARRGAAASFGLERPANDRRGCVRRPLRRGARRRASARHAGHDRALPGTGATDRRGVLRGARSATRSNAPTRTGRIAGGVDRTNLWAMQTPQIFSLPLLVRAYRDVIDAGETVTDETQRPGAHRPAGVAAQQRRLQPEDHLPARPRTRAASVGDAGVAEF